MKFFTIDRIKEACTHLTQFHSGMVIVPLVLAVNGINQRTLSRGTAGTDNGFLKEHFHGHLIGLCSVDTKSNFRPKFREITAPDIDFVSFGRQLLWANLYSQRAFGHLKTRGLITTQGRSTNTVIKLEPGFKYYFENELGADFHFEELLVWLYAFSGFPETINSWQDLFNHFQDQYLGQGNRLENDYSGRFHVNNNIAWPTDLLDERPSNEHYQHELLPSLEGPAAPMANTDLTALSTEFRSALDESGLKITFELVNRFLASLLTKRFLIFTGLAGSGKTKLAQSFAKWICENDEQYAVVPVGPDWTSNENVIGYPDALNIDRYIIPKILELILEASKPENEGKPYFLILDEMNLSHVERYFADVLSAFESNEKLNLHNDEATRADQTVRSGVPKNITLPENLFVIGTVNVDETTYMFSPKVLDRANVIEFRVSIDELAAFLDSPRGINLEGLSAQGTHFSEGFVDAAKLSEADLEEVEQNIVKKELLELFSILSHYNLEFGFRVAKEVVRFIYFYRVLLGDRFIISEAIDFQILQKLLPKLHGSRRKMESFLWALSVFCFFEHKWETEVQQQQPERNDLTVEQNQGTEPGNNNDVDQLEIDQGEQEPRMELANLEEIKIKINDALKLKPDLYPLREENGVKSYRWENAYYRLSFEKLQRMIKQLEQNGFVSFAEA